MKALKFIGFTLINMFGVIVFAVVLGLGSLFAHSYLQSLLFGRGEYLLGVSNGINLVALFMLTIMTMYGVYKVTVHFFGNAENQAEDIETAVEEEDAEPLSKFEERLITLLIALASIKLPSSKLNMSKIMKYFCIPILVIVTYYGITDYAILYTDSVKVSTPWNPAGVVYKYSDIKRIDVRIDDNGKNSYSPSYIVVFDDGKWVDFFGETMFEDTDEGFENILIDLDEKLRAQGADKTVDKTNFEKYAQGMDKHFVSKVEELFVD